MSPYDGAVCSGNGDCRCGGCVCGTVPGSGQQFAGQFCHLVMTMIMIMIVVMMIIRCLEKECVVSWRPVSTARHLIAALSTAKIVTLIWTSWKMTSSRRARINSSPSLRVSPKQALIANTNIQV